MNYSEAKKGEIWSIDMSVSPNDSIIKYYAFVKGCAVLCIDKRGNIIN
jgi:hypothetical protein